MSGLTEVEWAPPDLNRRPPGYEPVRQRAGHDSGSSGQGELPHVLVEAREADVHLEVLEPDVPLGLVDGRVAKDPRDTEELVVGRIRQVGDSSSAAP